MKLHARAALSFLSVSGWVRRVALRSAGSASGSGFPPEIKSSVRPAHLPAAMLALGFVVVLAAAAPLIGKVLRLPSILVLLALGFGAGAAGALDPNALLGQQLISAVVSVAIGIILFEAGLGLKLKGSAAPSLRWRADW